MIVLLGQLSSTVALQTDLVQAMLYSGPSGHWTLAALDLMWTELGLATVLALQTELGLATVPVLALTELGLLRKLARVVASHHGGWASQPWWTKAWQATLIS